VIMSRPRITKELAGRALAELLTGMAGNAGSADLRTLVGAPGTPQPGSALAELARLKAEAAANSATGKLTPSEELRQVIREELVQLLTTSSTATGDKPDGGAK